VEFGHLKKKIEKY